MTETVPHLEANEEVVHEIEELEKAARFPARTWAFGVLACLVLLLVALAAFLWNQVGEAQGVATPAAMGLRALGDGLAERPPVFRWASVPDAASYVFIVRERLGEVVLIRAASDPWVQATDVEFANFIPGDYVWTLEARRPDGTRAGFGEGRFTIPE